MAQGCTCVPSFHFSFCFLHSSVFTERPALLQSRLLGPRGTPQGRAWFPGSVPRRALGVPPGLPVVRARGKLSALHARAGATGMFPRLLGDGELKASLSAWPGQLHRPLPGQSHHLWVPSTLRQPWPTLVSPPQTPSPSLLIPVSSNLEAQFKYRLFSGALPYPADLDARSLVTASTCWLSCPRTHARPALCGVCPPADLTHLSRVWVPRRLQHPGRGSLPPVMPRAC